ncbi:MAG: tetratricopeptide repeat protein [Nitrososphaerales archaeon]
MNNLAVIYANGPEVDQKIQQAFHWYYYSAIQGNTRAQYNLGSMYEVGLGIPQDFKEAAKWYYSASLQNDGDAKWKFCSLKFTKPEVVKDYPDESDWCLGGIISSIASVISPSTRFIRMLSIVGLGRKVLGSVAKTRVTTNARRALRDKPNNSVHRLGP